VIVPGQPLGLLLHDDPTVFDYISPVDGFQALADVLLGDEQGNPFLELPEAVKELGNQGGLQSTRRLIQDEWDQPSARPIASISGASAGRRLFEPVRGET
jgi:hypothetical protein